MLTRQYSSWKHTQNLYIGITHAYHLAGRGHPVPLQEPPERSTSTTHTVCVESKIEIPPSSELEVMAKVDESVGEGTWVMEESANVRLPIAVARALVETMTNRVPVRLLNPRSEPITLYAGTEVATLERVEIPAETVSAVGNVHVPEAGEQVQDMLWELAEKAGPGLTSSEKETFFHLLVLFADIFAKFTAYPTACSPYPTSSQTRGLYASQRDVAKRSYRTLHQTLGFSCRHCQKEGWVNSFLH